MPKTGSDLIVDGEIILSGEVLLDDYAAWMWEEDVYFTPRMVREALVQLGEGRVTLRLCSLGGHVWAGEAIRSAIASHPGGCRIIVEGIAASAASMLFMAAAERVMTAGSLLMIHDPSGMAWGTEEDMRRKADGLAVSANTYAAVYAAAAGKTTEEVRKIMKAETWFSPETAIAEGFADSILTDVREEVPVFASVEMAKTKFMESGRMLQMRLAKKPAGADRPGQIPAAAGGVTASVAATLEMNMTTPVTTPPLATPVAPVVVAPVMLAAPDPVMAERKRIQDINLMAAPFLMSGRLTQEDVSALVADGTSAEGAGARFMAKMAAAEPPSRSTGSFAVITRDETDTKLEGMIGALMRKTDGPAAEYRGLKMKRLAMELSGQSRSFDETSAIRRGMVSTTMMGGALGVSDFAYITTQVMGRTLLAEYERRAASWQLVTGQPISANDFREIHAVRFGGDFALKKVLENGEYEQATLADEAEGLKVERRGRTINLTFEAVINDDMGAFNRIPREFAMAARTMESQMVWALIRSNAVLKSDGLALFHATHGNLAGSAGAISVASVAAARKAMWEQRAFGAKDTDDFIPVEADRLIVPPALELVALQFNATIVPTKGSDANPYKSKMDVHPIANIGAAAGGSDTAWYMVSSDFPPIQHAYLEGYEAPTVQTIEGMNPDVVKMDARHIFGAAATEFRGSFKNAGA